MRSSMTSVDDCRLRPEVGQGYPSSVDHRAGGVPIRPDVRETGLPAGKDRGCLAARAGDLR